MNVGGRAAVGWHARGLGVRIPIAPQYFGPCKSGEGEFVWCIDELDRTDKHIELIQVAGANTGLGIDGGKLLAAAFPGWPHGQFPSMPFMMSGRAQPAPT